MDIAQFKDQYFSSPSLIALNNAGVSQISNRTLETLKSGHEKVHRLGAGAYPELISEMEQTRSRLAAFLGATPEETVFFGSTAAAISQIALSFPLQKGDEILTWDQEYPSNFYPWKVAAEKAGAKLVIAKSEGTLETSAERLLSFVGEKTKIIAFSWVQYRTGSVTDLNTVTSFAKARGIFTCADIIQGAGAVPFDFQRSGLDAACGGSHKFFSSPLGIGYLLLQKKHLTRFFPTSVGAFTFGTPEDLSNPDAAMRTDVLRYEPGAKNIVDIVAFGTSLQLFNEVGIENIHAEIVRLADQLYEGIQNKGFKINSLRQTTRVPHVNFTCDEKAKNRLLEKGAQFGIRPPGLRLSPHAFTRDETISQFLSLL